MNVQTAPTLPVQIHGPSSYSCHNCRWRGAFDQRRSTRCRSTVQSNCPAVAGVDFVRTYSPRDETSIDTEPGGSTAAVTGHRSRRIRSTNCRGICRGAAAVRAIRVARIAGSRGEDLWFRTSAFRTHAPPAVQAACAPFRGQHDRPGPLPAPRVVTPTACVLARTAGRAYQDSRTDGLASAPHRDCAAPSCVAWHHMPSRAGNYHRRLGERDVDSCQGRVSSR